MRRLLWLCALVSAVLAGCAAQAQSPPAESPIPMTALPTLTTAQATTTTTEPADVEPPEIGTTPRHGDTVDAYQSEFIVTTEPGATLTIEGDEIDHSDDGIYVFRVANTPGPNAFSVRSTDAEGNVAQERVRYDYAPQDGWVAAIGDSIMLGARPQIEEFLGEGVVDATVSRQFAAAPALVKDMVTRPDPPEVILVGLGTNGPVQERHFEEVMEAAGSKPLVVFVNVRMPRSWEAESNTQIEAGVLRYDNAVLVDWYGATEDRRELFAGDRVHPSGEGRGVLADLIAETIFSGIDVLDPESSSGPGNPYGAFAVVSGS